MAVGPEVLPNNSFNAIAHDGIADFPGHSNAKPRPVKVIFTKRHNKKTIRNTVCLPGKIDKLAPLEQFVGFLQAIAAGLHQTARRFRPLARRLLITR
ncbi:hypothetical protein HNR65_000256 [Desulfosalsimonas propionicica]|uniref:Uncharacterized protein n=1 Tax=Desulfosalsimonas propionicica TaxID=332175 RepID=A0A7W0HJ88_9BACT|nr:hypothetical protein [Desulfosalsimonas propionicica]